MADRRTYLVDTSALNRLRTPSVAARLVPLIAEQDVYTCALVDLEVLYSAKSLRDYEELSLELTGLIDEPIRPGTMTRAREVQHELARTGHHRVTIADLVIAAVAELEGHTVLHYDGDYERIARITRQRCEWVVPRGSVS